MLEFFGVFEGFVGQETSEVLEEGLGACFGVLLSFEVDDGPEVFGRE